MSKKRFVPVVQPKVPIAGPVLIAASTRGTDDNNPSSRVSGRAMLASAIANPDSDQEVAKFVAEQGQKRKREAEVKQLAARNKAVRLKSAQVAAELNRDAEAARQLKQASRKQVKRHRLSVPKDDKETSPPKYGVVGAAIRFEYLGLVLPFSSPPLTSDQSNEVLALLKSNSMLALCMWTILHKCHNTVTGKMALWYGTIYTSAYAHPVAIGHYSLWIKICAMCYSAFSSRNTNTGYRKKDLQEALLPFVGQNIHLSDLVKLRVLSGADRMKATGMARKQSHFVISIYLLRCMGLYLKDVSSVGDLLYNEEQPDKKVFCTDRRVTKESLREIHGISAFKLTNNASQVKFSAAAHFGRQSDKKGFDKLTPSFGITYSMEQLEMLATVRQFFNGADKPPKPSHMESFYALNGSPIQDDATIRATFTEVPDDSHLRPSADNNYNYKLRRKYVAAKLPYMPTVGRPNRHSATLVKLKKAYEQEYTAKVQPPVRRRKQLPGVRVVGVGKQIAPGVTVSNKPFPAEVVPTPAKPVLAVALDGSSEWDEEAHKEKVEELSNEFQSGSVDTFDNSADMSAIIVGLFS